MVAEVAIQHYFSELQTIYPTHDEVLLYLSEVYADVLNQIDDFAPQLDSQEDIDLRRYEVNLIIDNSETVGAPVIMEQNPTFVNLFGRLEYEMEAGAVFTHFTNIKGGSLHKANGGTQRPLGPRRHFQPGGVVADRAERHHDAPEDAEQPSRVDDHDQRRAHPRSGRQGDQQRPEASHRARQQPAAIGLEKVADQHRQGVERDRRRHVEKDREQ